MDEGFKWWSSGLAAVVALAVVVAIGGYKCNKDDDTVTRDCINHHTPHECVFLNH